MKTQTDIDTAATELIGVADVAALTGLAPRTVVSYAAGKVIPSVRIAHARLYRRSEIVAWQAARERQRELRAASANAVTDDQTAASAR